MNPAYRMLAVLAAIFLTGSLKATVYFDAASHTQTVPYTVPIEYYYIAQPVTTEAGAAVTVTSVDIVLAAVSETPAPQSAIYIFGASGGHPGSVVGTLTATGPLVKGTNTFTGSVALSPATNYFIGYATTVGSTVVTCTNLAEGAWHNSAAFPKGVFLTTFNGAATDVGGATWVQAKDVSGSYDLLRIKVTGYAGDTPPPPTGRGTLANLSIRTNAGSAAQTVIVGFAVAGGSKNLLIRGAGPMLGRFGVGNFVADPKLAIYDGDTVIVSNDNWGGSTELRDAASRVGAQPFDDNSKDAAVLTVLQSKPYTVQLSGGSGIVLGEIYDADTGATSSRLSNVSARAQVGTGDNILIAGVAVAGNAPVHVLIRGIGPKLADYQVSGVLADPQLKVYSGDTVIADNDNWGGSAELKAAFDLTGAFKLADNSKDAALLIDLAPGVYTVQVSGVGGTTGIALAEIYEMPLP